MLAGTSLVALEERLLLAAQPVVVVADGLPTVAAPIGGQAQFTVTFDNTANPGDANVGYAPFIDLVLPKRGADGVLPNAPPHPDPAWPSDEDGVTFVSASYAGITLTPITLVFDTNGRATHPLLRDSNNNPVVVEANSFRILDVGNEAARAGPGDQLVVLQLPFGSFVPEQPKVTVNVTANVSNLADLNTPLPVVARGGFAFGSDPLNDPVQRPSPAISDPPIIGEVRGNTITPTVLTVSKTYNWEEGETATGPNFVRSFTINLDVVTGQTVSNILLTDVLPDGIVVSGTPTVSVLGEAVAANSPGAPVYNPATHTLTATIARDVLGRAGAEVTMTVPFFVRDMLAPGTPAHPVLDPASGGQRTLGNNVMVAADWLPIDVRDQSVDAPHTIPFTFDPSGPEASVTAKIIATQKTQNIISPAPDPTPNRLGPGDTIRYTVDVQVSDYFRLGDVVLTDILSDGQAFVPGSARLVATERGTPIGSTDILAATNLFNVANLDADRPPGDGQTTLTFRISDELRARSDDGFLFGGRINPTDNVGGTTLRITYDAVVERSYEAAAGPITGKLNQGDTLRNSVTVSADVLDSNNTTTGHRADDISGRSVTLPVGGGGKSVYAVNNVLVSSGLVPSTDGRVQVASGDTVTFRLRYELPLTATRNLAITDFLPLPIFTTAPAPWSFQDAVSAAAPALNVVKWGPDAGTFNTIFDALAGADLSRPSQPTITASQAANSIRIDFGRLDPANVQTSTVDLLFTVEVKDRPFGDGLLFTNVMESTEKNTLDQDTKRVDLEQVVLNEPNLKIHKGVVAKDSASLGTFSPGNVGPAGVTFLAPGTAGTVGTPAFTGTISSVGTITNGGLASRPVNSDITNLDAGDTVTFAIVVENTGNGPRGAFDVTVKDVRPAGFVIPTGGLNLRVTDGTGAALAHTLLTDGLFGAGIQIDDTTSQGGLQAFNENNGRNIAVITYDLTVDQSVQAREVLRNAGEITRFAALNNGENRINNEPPGDIRADATATMRAPTITKVVTSTSETSTGSLQGNGSIEDATIGEIVNYRITITLQEGATNALKLIDFVQLGAVPSGAGPGRLELLSAQVTDIGQSLYRLPTDPLSPLVRLPKPLAVISDSTTDSDTFDDRVVFDFGGVLNLSDNVQDAEDTITVTVSARVLNVDDNAAGDVLRNTARLEFSPLSGPNNVSATADIEVVVPGLRIDKSAPPEFRLPGETVNYRITLTNPSTLPNGESAFTTTAHNIVLTDALLDPYLELEPGSVRAPEGITIVSTTDGTLRVELAALAVGASATIDFQARVLLTTPAAVTLENTATATFSSLPVSGGRTGSVSDTVQVPVGPSLTKAIVWSSNDDTGLAFGNPALPDLAIGEAVTYLLTITLPQGATQNLLLSDTLPSGLEPLAVRVLPRDPLLTTSTPTTAINGQLVTVNFGTAQNNTSPVVDAADVIRVELDARVTGTALINAASLGFTIGGRNDTLSARAPADPIAPQLTIGKTAGSAGGNPGDLVTYTVTVGHGGASQMPGYDITVRDPLDPRLVPISVSSTMGTAAISGQVMTLTLDRLALNQQAVMTYTVRLAETAQPGQTILNTATLRYDSNPGPGGAQGTGSADAMVRVGTGGLPPQSLITKGMFSGYADEFRRLRENAFTAPAIFAGSSQPGAAVMLHLRDSDGGPITMMGVVADIGGHWIANPMQSGISGPADPNGLQLVRGLAGRDDGEDTILPPPPPARPAPTPTTMPYTLLADHTPASFDTRGTNTDVARLTYAGAIQPGGLFAGSPDAPGIAAAGAVGAALQKDLRGLAAPMSLGWNRFALDFAAATAAASVAGR